MDALGFAARHSHGLRSRRRIGHVERGVDIGRRLAPRPDAIDRMIARDRHQPGDRAEIRNSKTVGLRPYLDEDLLQRLFGICPVIQDTKADAEKFRAGLPVEQIERGPVLHRSPDDRAW